MADGLNMSVAPVSSGPRSEMIVFLTSCVLLLSGSSSSLVTPKYDTIVVGLGSAGTSAASTLARAGRRVLALEAQDRVGGRVWTRSFGDGVVEAGAEWVHGQEHSRVYDLAMQNNLTMVVQDAPLKVLQSNGSSNQLFAYLLEYGLKVKEDGSEVNEPMGEFIERRLKEHLQTKNPELLNDKDALDSLFDLMNRVVNNLEASNDWNDVTALQGGYEQLEGNQTTSWHRYGYKTFFDLLLNTYNNGPGLPTLDMKLNAEVTSIQWSESGVLVTCADGARYSADNVVVTVSLGVLKERHASLFSPPLPKDKVTAIQVLTIGVVDKIILQFPARPTESFTLFGWSAADRREVPREDQWTTQLLGLSAPAGSSDTLTLWAMGETAKLVETLPEEVVQVKVYELLKRFLGSNIPEPVSIIRTTWYSNPFTRGSYSFDNLEVPKHPGLRAALAAPLVVGGAPRVLFAGEATDNRHYSTVHGASDTGYREAQRLLAAV